MRRIVIFGVLVAGLWFAFGRGKPTIVGTPFPVVVASVGSEREPPLQREVDQQRVIQMDGYEVKTLAQFALMARALSIETYSVGRESNLSPLDVAFGWGRMSEPAVAGQLAISQGGRWYRWRYEGQPPIPVREIEVSSANMHLIPADAAVARSLSNIRKGQIVRLSGYLVEVRAKDGWSWRSSLTRDDTGQGSCEVIFVQAVDVS